MLKSTLITIRVLMSLKWKCNERNGFYNFGNGNQSGFVAHLFLKARTSICEVILFLQLY